MTPPLTVTLTRKNSAAVMRLYDQIQNTTTPQIVNGLLELVLKRCAPPAGRPRLVTDAVRAKARALRDAGYPWVAIADRVGANANTLRSLASRGLL